MNIAAILVSFDPERDPLPVVAQLNRMVASTIVVDNHPDCHGALRDPAHVDAVVIRNANVGGLAGAYNRALAWIEANRPDITHILFVDDDSDVKSLRQFLDSDVTQTHSRQPDVAAVAPVYRDKRTGMRGRHIQLNRFTFHFLDRELDDPADVTFVINSMSLWRRDALIRLGPYSETLRIDHIDTEYAMRAKRAGYRIVLNAKVQFLHEIGQRRTYKVLGRTVQSGGHGPARRYLIGRNTVIIALKHGIRYPSFMMLCAQRLAYETLGILMVEDRKLPKILSLWRGAFSGIVERA